MARLIQSEALSESYANKLAVGNVVMNRMKLKKQDLHRVVYARSQFSGVNGRLFKQKPSEECIKVAQEVLDGNNNIGKATHFVDLTVVKPSWVKKMKFVKRIDNHWFYYNESY